MLEPVTHWDDWGWLRGDQSATPLRSASFEPPGGAQGWVDVWTDVRFVDEESGE